MDMAPPRPEGQDRLRGGYLNPALEPLPEAGARLHHRLLVWCATCWTELTAAQ